jgi:uncharacterized protein YndB with AHSA1/START domain
MTVTDVHQDAESLSLTIRVELDASLSRTWLLWEDPRQLERWWGPPTYPATFVHFELAPGGMVSYFMTGPDGDQARGWWRIRTVDAPRFLEFDNGFADGDGNPEPGAPVTSITVELRERAVGGTTMTVQTRFPSLAAMEKIIDMGLAEGMAAAIGQMEDVLGSETAHH